ncbi:hypothetical protein BH10PSE17_BH10PSE17_36290 [soil metagenome]
MLRQLAVVSMLAWPLLMAARPPSVCPYSMNDRPAATRALRTFGTSIETARLCKVGKAVIDRTVAETLDTYRPCLQQLGMRADEIDAAMAAGVPDARADYAKVADPVPWCKAVREAHPE